MGSRRESGRWSWWVLWRLGWGLGVGTLVLLRLTVPILWRRRPTVVPSWCRHRIVGLNISLPVALVLWL